jgi:uncharacterized protein YhaN
MRLLELRLMAFGPFTDETLCLTEQGPGIDVIYGPNEAGKSTALRAITGLLYGIDARTADDHVHDKPKLRIGAKIGRASGETFEVVRRKGSKSTLLGPDGEPLDDAVMQRALVGVSRDMFLTMFGLDDKTLEAAARALLEGGGAVGESLFDAGGARGVGKVLEKLREEADGIFKARGQNQPLNTELRQLKEAKDAFKLKGTLPKAWTEQKETLERAQREHADVRAKRQELGAEKSRLTRVKKALPHLAKRRKLLRDARLSMNEAIAAVDDDAISEIGRELERARSGVNDLPKQEGRLHELEADAAQLLKELGCVLPLERASELLIDRPQQIRIQTLIGSRAAVEHAWDSVRDDIARGRATIKAEQARLELLGGEVSLRGLRGTIKRALRDADIDAQLDQAQTTAERLGQQVEQRHAALGLHEGSASEAARLSVPSAETIQKHRAEWDESARTRKLAVQQLGERRRELDTVDKEIEALERVQAVPDEQQLGEARARREELWQELKGKRTKANESDYEKAVVDADTLADRMWREADRVARRARLAVEREHAARAIGQAVQEQTALSAAREREQDAWRSEWQPVGIEPLSPSEMLRWRERHQELVDLMERERESRDASNRLVSQRQALRTKLVAELEGVGSSIVAGNTLSSALDAAELTSDELGAREQERRALASQLSSRRADFERLDAELAIRAEARQQCRAEWAACMQTLGLADDAPVEVASAYLAGLSDLRAKLIKVVEVRRRVEGIRRDRLQFDQHVGELAKRVGLDHAGDTVVIAEELARCAADQREVEAQLRSEEERLLELGEGADIEQLEEMARSEDADAVNVRLGQLAGELEELEEDSVRLNRSIGSWQAQLDAWAEAEGAYGAASDVQSSLAGIRSLAERYARTRLAALLLEQEIERYRKANEGPVVRRARELFDELTLGRYRDLRAEYHAGDAPELRCIRHDGSDVGVDGLSAGTRDQLYLALRLASLERYAERSEVVPFVADDLLNRFDHDRKRAALEVLLRFSRTTQVLFFTHELPLVQLAREVLPADGLREHQLGAERLTRASGRASMPAL